MQINFADAKSLVVDILTNHGVPDEHSVIVADHLVDAAAAGHAFAGLPRVLALVEHLKDKPGGRPIGIEARGSNAALVDGAGNNGYVTSILGITGLWIAILADTGATVLVTLNALRLLGFDPTKEA